MLKKCVICGAVFDAINCAKTCSVSCSAENKYRYRQRTEVKKRQLESSHQPKAKERLRKYRQRPEVKERLRKCKQRPEAKENVRRHHQRPEVRKKQLEYSQQPGPKEKKRKRARIRAEVARIMQMAAIGDAIGESVKTQECQP